MAPRLRAGPLARPRAGEDQEGSEDAMAGTGGRMLVLAQVAPYADGPAGVHGVLPQAQAALAELAEMADLNPTVVHDVRTLGPDLLGSDVPSPDDPTVLALFTIGETPFTPVQRQAITSAWHSGGLRILGVHSATDACHTWDGYGDLLGARFAGHPWTRDFTIDVLDPTHPATAHVGPTWDWHDEIYLFSGLRSDARILLELAPGQVDLSAPGARVPECGYPLAWCVEDGPSRTFYSALGHFPAAWESTAYLRHLAGGLSWLCGGVESVITGSVQ
ncbi:MAG: ThuA domain-containing protein [Acidimicrobiales bacterium]